MQLAGGAARWRLRRLCPCIGPPNPIKAGVSTRMACLGRCTCSFPDLESRPAGLERRPPGCISPKDGNHGNDGNANLKRRSQVCYESQAPVRQKKFTESAFTMGRATGIQGTTAPPSR